MLIRVNDEQHDVKGSALADILDELGYGDARVATALDGVFVPVRQRAERIVQEGASLEIVAPMQGG